MSLSPIRTRSLVVTLLLSAGLASTASAQENLDDADGFRWDIDVVRGTITDGLSASTGAGLDAYDSYVALCVKLGTSTAPCTLYATSGAPATLSPDGREVRLEAVAMGALQVSRRIQVPATGIGYARFLEILENPSATAVTAFVRVGAAGYGSLGSDGSTVVYGSVPTTGLGPGLQWVVTDDSPTSGDPGICHLFDGAGGVSVVVAEQVGGSLDQLDVEYGAITVPAFGRAIVAHLEAMRTTESEAESVCGLAFSAIETGLGDLAPADRAAVVNFPSGTVTPFCGDGGIDSGEVCDDGASNSDSVAGACRTDCSGRVPGGSDAGVVDLGAGVDLGGVGDDGGASIRGSRRSRGGCTTSEGPPTGGSLVGFCAALAVLVVGRRRRR